MSGGKNDVFRILRIKKSDDLKTIYAKVRRAFTAADLQRYTEIEKGVPAETLMAELDAIHRDEMRKLRQRKPNRKRKP